MTPDEHETLKRLFWERALLVLLRDQKSVDHSIKYAAELADKVLDEWRERFEKK